MTDLNTVMETLKSRLQSVAPTRIVTRSYRDFADRPKLELEAGVFTVLSRGESDYHDLHPAEFGTHRMLVIGQILLAEGATGEAVEQAEFALVDEIKAVTTAALPPELDGLTLLRFSQSGQLEAPYGWIVAELEKSIRTIRR
ncbi:MAG TPA: hypothetical protein VEC14_09455 [Reyranellaceae bacterium]|nr:hypothetical protein [Reyranellaceae bacterium]